MGNKGYGLENEIETYFLTLTGQDRGMPLYERCHRITASGAMRGDKGDVVTLNVSFLPKNIMVECKRRKEIAKSGKVLHIYEDWLEKAEEEAHNQNCIPVFVGSYFRATMNRKQVVVTEEFFEFSGIQISSLGICGIIPAIVKKHRYFLLDKTQLDFMYRSTRKCYVYDLPGTKKYYLLSWDLFTNILEKMRGPKET